jgi:hypothetical protein
MSTHLSTPENNQIEEDSASLERRAAPSDRRKRNDRRSWQERRHDNRLAPVKHPIMLKEWLQSLVYPRLGVDRRKNSDRRHTTNRRLQGSASLLTQEELKDLLS